MTRDQIKRVIGYVRVSTADQGESGAGLEAQRQAITAKAAERGWELVTIYQDVASGRSMKRRPELKKALADLKAHRADAIIAAKLDRLSRSMFDFADLVQRSTKQNWAIVLVDIEIDTSTAMGEAMAGMAVVFAQLERRMIGERTRDALAVKRAQGVRLGRPRSISPEVERRIVRRRQVGKSFQAIADELTAAGIPTPTGREAWSWGTVERVVRRRLDEPIRRRAATA